MNEPVETILQYFSWHHLPPSLQPMSKRFAELAEHVVATVPRSAERTVALRKLLEGKDAAVRACLTPPVPWRERHNETIAEHGELSSLSKPPSSEPST